MTARRLETIRSSGSCYPGLSLLKLLTIHRLVRFDTGLVKVFISQNGTPRKHGTGGQGLLFAAYLVGSGTPASWNPFFLNRQLSQVPQASPWTAGS